MNNTQQDDYILRSEVRKMIENRLISIAGGTDEIDFVQEKLLEDLLSELDNLSGVSGWIDVKEEK